MMMWPVAVVSGCRCCHVSMFRGFAVSMFLECRCFGVSMFWGVDDLECRWFGVSISMFCCVDVLLCRC
jgi:hypothetical protein